MSDAASLAAAAADRDEAEVSFDIDSAADAIEQLIDGSGDPRRRGGAPGGEGGADAPAADDRSTTAASAPDDAMREPQLRVRLGDEEGEVSLPELAALLDRLGGHASSEAGGQPASPPMPDSAWLHEAQAQQLATAIPALQQRLQAFAGMNWERMAAEDPALFAQARPAFEALSGQLAEAEAAAFALAEHQAHARASAVSHAHRLGTERQALAAKVPEFADPQRAPREAAALLGYLAKAGYDPADIDGLTDHRHVVLARKAMLYDRLQEGRARVAETVKALPRVQAPGSAPERRVAGVERRGAMMQRLRRSGRLEDAARLIEDLI